MIGVRTAALVTQWAGVVFALVAVCTTGPKVDFWTGITVAAAGFLVWLTAEWRER